MSVGRFPLRTYLVVYMLIHVYTRILYRYGRSDVMSKRVRKVAFADEVQVEDKRRRENEAEDGEESAEEKTQRSECALIRILPRN